MGRESDQIREGRCDSVSQCMLDLPVLGELLGMTVGLDDGTVHIFLIQY